MKSLKAATVESFYRHGMPGMTLKAKPDALKPLVKRCLDCPRQISNGRVRCKHHQDQWMAELASQIDTPELLQLVLDRNFAPELRPEVLAALKPHLSFTV